MNTEKVLNLTKKMSQIISSKTMVNDLLLAFTSEDEIDEMLDYLDNNRNLTKFDVNTQVFRITLRKKGIKI